MTQDKIKQWARDRIEVRLGPLALHRKEQWDLDCWPLIAAHWKRAGSSKRVFALWDKGIALPKRVLTFATLRNKLTSFASKALRTRELVGAGVLLGVDNSSAKDVYISLMLIWEPRDMWRGLYWTKRTQYERVIKPRGTRGVQPMTVFEAFVCVLPLLPLRLRIEWLPEYHTRGV